MDVNCKKCNKDISAIVDKKFEKFEVGRITCPECGYVQKRYISKRDLMLYLGLCEILYFFLSLAAIYVFDNIGGNWWLIPIFVLILTIAYFIQKTFSRYIYEKSPYSIDNGTKNLNEDLMDTKKNVNTQFIIYFVLAFCAITSVNYRIDFLIGMAVITIATLLRFFVNKK